GKDHGDPNRMRYDDGLYFKNHLEIAEAFPGRPDVLENTLRIADEVDLQFGKKYYVPRFPTESEGFASEEEMLRAWVWSGARQRYGKKTGDDSSTATVQAASGQADGESMGTAGKAADDIPPH